MASSTTSDSSTYQVFNTMELLELILLELDMSTLLRSQRVCRAFQGLIETSPLLRQKLWFDVSPKSTTTTTTTTTTTPTPPLLKPILNPLLLSAINKGTHPYMRFLELDRPYTLGLYPSLSRRLKPPEPPTICVAVAPHARRAEWSGSWRRMIVSQPHDARTRWDAYVYQWMSRDWACLYTTTFEEAPVRAGRLVGFTMGPGWKKGEGD